MEAGRMNSICDVSGIRVGHATVTRDQPFVSRTGVTVVVPDADLPQERLAAAAVVFNGTGEMTGFHQVNEWGSLETPVALTGTAAVPAVLQGLSDHMFERCPGLGVSQEPCLPVVAECDDMWLSDTRHPAIGPADVARAIRSASGDQSEWGSVGAGTGMVSFGFKGGVGTSSRRVQIEGETHHLGALCLVNFGQPGDLMVAGHHIGHLPGEVERDRLGAIPPAGSLIVVLATDAPLGHHQLARVARRAALGMARVGSQGSEGSGDIYLAFSTKGTREDRQQPWLLQPVLRQDLLGRFLRAAVEVTEEGILNALFAAEDMVGFRSRTVLALPQEEVRRRTSPA
jgi:D-aminopeptidase